MVAVASARVVEVVPLLPQPWLLLLLLLVLSLMLGCGGGGGGGDGHDMVTPTICYIRYEICELMQYLL